MIQFLRKARLQRFHDLIFADGCSRVAPPLAVRASQLKSCNKTGRKSYQAIDRLYILVLSRDREMVLMIKALETDDDKVVNLESEQAVEAVTSRKGWSHRLGHRFRRKQLLGFIYERIASNLFSIVDKASSNSV